MLPYQNDLEQPLCIYRDSEMKQSAFGQFGTITRCFIYMCLYALKNKKKHPYRSILAHPLGFKICSKVNKNIRIERFGKNY